MGMTDIAYEKGAAFLQTVESVVGRDRLDTFLRGYFDHFAFQPHELGAHGRVHEGEPAVD